jgi:hypothetical protein
MKYTIEGFCQSVLIALHCDTTDAVILRYIVDFYNSGSMQKIQVGRKEFFWVNYQTVMEEIPIIKIANKRALQSRFMKYVEQGLMEFHLLQNRQTYFRFTPKYDSLVSSSKKQDVQRLPEIGQSQGGVVVKTTRGLQSKLQGGCSLNYKGVVVKHATIDSSINDQSTRDQKSGEKKMKPEQRHTFRAPALTAPCLSIFWETFPDTTLTIFQQEQIAALPDGERWRKACLWWKAQGYNPRSVGRMLERYEEDISFPNRKEKQSTYEHNATLLHTDVIF